MGSSCGLSSCLDTPRQDRCQGKDHWREEEGKRERNGSRLALQNSTIFYHILSTEYSTILYALQLYQTLPRLYDNRADMWSQNVRLGSPMRVVVGLILLPSHCIHTLILGRVGRVEDVEVTVTLCTRQKQSLVSCKKCPHTQTMYQSGYETKIRSCG